MINRMVEAQSIRDEEDVNRGEGEAASRFVGDWAHQGLHYESGVCVSSSFALVSLCAF